MRHRGRLIEVLRRAENGPMIDEKDFEAKLITSTVNVFSGLYWHLSSLLCQKSAPRPQVKTSTRPGQAT